MQSPFAEDCGEQPSSMLWQAAHLSFHRVSSSAQALRHVVPALDDTCGVLFALATAPPDASSPALRAASALSTGCRQTDRPATSGGGACRSLGSAGPRETHACCNLGPAVPLVGGGAPRPLVKAVGRVYAIARGEGAATSVTACPFCARHVRAALGDSPRPVETHFDGAATRPGRDSCVENLALRDVEALGRRELGFPPPLFDLSAAVVPRRPLPAPVRLFFVAPVQPSIARHPPRHAHWGVATRASTGEHVESCGLEGARAGQADLHYVDPHVGFAILFDCRLWL